jgi:hypothetical protein
MGKNAGDIPETDQELYAELDRKARPQTTVEAMLETKTFTGSPVLHGMAVSRIAGGDVGRQFAGVIVELATENGKPTGGVWVHGLHDAPDSMTWYAARQLDLASDRELVDVARWALGQRYGAFRQMQAEHEKEGSR